MPRLESATEPDDGTRRAHAVPTIAEAVRHIAALPERERVALSLLLCPEPAPRDR